MRFPAPAVFGVAVFLSGIAGCAATRRADQDVRSWENTSPVSPITPYKPLGVWFNSPSRYDGISKIDEFNFSHPRVDSFVTRFQTSLRGFFSGALSRSGRYVPRMSSILEKEGVPPELAYLPLIESGFRPQAVSRAGAVGPWQLIPGTGRRYGLRIDRYVDERRDPVKSTQAAARYLKDLHEMFGDWHLSLAAYNTGEQNIVRILERERIADFWEMSERGYLYDETRDFVPQFLAALHIAETPEVYGFDAPSDEPLRYDLVTVNRSLPLSTVARLVGTSPTTIKELNPALHRGVVPPSGYAVRLPKGSKEAFEIAYANLQTLPVVRRSGAVSSGRRHKGHVRRRVRRTAGAAHLRKSHRASSRALVRPHVRHVLPDRVAVKAVPHRRQPSIVATHKKGHAPILD